MVRRLLLFSLLLVSAATLSAQNCELTITATCEPGAHGSRDCQSQTHVNGNGCSGSIYSLWYSPALPETVEISTPDTNRSFDECYGSDFLGEFAGVTMSLCFDESGTLSNGSTLRSDVTVTGMTEAELMAMTFVIDAHGNEVASALTMVDATTSPCTPTISAPPIAQSGVPFTVSWSGVPDMSAHYVLQVSTTPDFSANVTEETVFGRSKTFLFDDMATATRYYFRVRATACQGHETPFSRAADTLVKAEAPIDAANAEIVVPAGTTQEILTEIFIPAPAGKTAMNTTFTAAMDKPFLGVNPKTGTFPAEGLTLTITARPGSLPPGASTGTLSLTTQSTPASNDGVAEHATTSLNIPVSVSIVTPVAPGAKTLPPPNTLIIPIVTHVNVTDGQFLSDVRLTNGSASPVDYQVTLSPTQTDARLTSKVTLVTVEPQKTIALNDIVKNFFGLGATNDFNDIGFGALEIRPLSSTTRTYASSRTYAKVFAGTFGQFISAVPMTKFATNALSTIPIPGIPIEEPSRILSLQQVAQSSKFRTNLGIVEGSGQPASGRIRIFNALGTLLKEVPFSLLPGEHRQMNRFISDPNFGGITSLEDGRIEIEIDSDTGAVTAYASVLDNLTTDPMAVMPVDASKVRATRYVIPGMAELPNRVDNFHSDMRVFNGGESDVVATLTYVPQGGAAPSAPQQRTIRAGEVLSVDNVLPSLFGMTNTGGSVVITTPGESSLVVTGRTYTLMEDGGTFGQFIPGVTPAESIGLGERTLEVLQLEESDRFRSNVGIAEVAGQPAVVEITVSTPEGKLSGVIEKALAPHEFIQFGRLINTLAGSQQTYNATVQVRVIGGSGRVTAYGSVIDNASKDPTYIPAQ